MERGGISAFLADMGMPGFNVTRRLSMLGNRYTYEIVIQDLRLPKSALPGQRAQGFWHAALRQAIDLVEDCQCRDAVARAAAVDLQQCRQDRCQSADANRMFGDQADGCRTGLGHHR
ncbi:MAG: hypothetical protein P1U48_13465 [Pseudooceanicola sp.]|nr:hypothetical protein [Pseudooceanicola sp.]